SAAITGGEGEVLLANGSITNQRMPTLSGTGEPGTIITLYNVSRHHRRRRRGATGKRQYYQSAYADPQRHRRTR
ncbi:hypothetical protein V5H41_29135, partial [Salmonella enterica]